MSGEIVKWFIYLFNISDYKEGKATAVIINFHIINNAIKVKVEISILNYKYPTYTKKLFKNEHQPR